MPFDARRETKWIAICIVLMWLSVGILGSQWLANIIGSSGVTSQAPVEIAAVSQVPEKFIDGPYGDTFGFLTALFTGLALAGLWYTIRLQSIELKETRGVLAQQATQLDEQAKHLKSQSDHLEDQLAIARAQAIEVTFFQLLQRFSEVARDVRFDQQNLTGRSAMREYKVKLLDNIRKALEKEGVKDDPLSEQAKDVIRKQVTNYLKAHGSELNHYFRMLCHVFKYLHEHPELPPEKKLAYAKIARAQLSSPEVSMLFYNGLVGSGTEFSDLVRLYGLLEHVDRADIIHKDHLANNVFYHENSFKGSALRR